MAQIRMKPLAVWDGNAVKHTLMDVEGAALFMLYHWPKEYWGSQLHIEAQMAALSVLALGGPAEHFRDAFIEAAAEADILALIDGGAPATCQTHSSS
jgi:hypothetical protein